MTEQELPKKTVLWLHERTGNVYRIIAFSNLHSTRLEEYPPSVVYQNVSDPSLIWSRPISTWWNAFKEYH